MRYAVFMSVALLAAFATEANAQDCRSISDPTQRLACYDDAAMSVSPSTRPEMQESSTRSFEFRGHVIGERLDGAFPKWQSSRDLCRRSRELIVCQDQQAKSPIGSTGLTELRVGGVHLTLLNYNYFDGRLVGLDMFMHVNWYREIHDMLVGKYGKPARQLDMPLQNRMGATFNNTRSEWDFKEGVLRFDKRSGSIDSSWLSFQNSLADAAIRAQSAAENARKGKQAF